VVTSSFGSGAQDHRQLSHERPRPRAVPGKSARRLARTGTERASERERERERETQREKEI
jgi:hypothetical protein